MSDGEAEDEVQLQKLRSIYSQQRTFVRFVNKTEKFIDIEWLNFEGNHVPYLQRIQPDRSLSMTTYQSHPWIFYDSDCRHPLVTKRGNQQIYFPEEFAGRQHLVEIIEPLNSLQQICLNIIHRHLSITCGLRETETFSSRVALLPIPQSLRETLNGLSRDQNNNNKPFYVLPEE